MVEFLSLITLRPFVFALTFGTFFLVILFDRESRRIYTKESLINLFSPRSYHKGDAVLLITCSSLIVLSSILWKSDLFSSASSLIGLLNVILVAKGSMYNYPLGLFAVLSYGSSAFSQGLYGDFSLNYLIFYPSNIVGMLMWSRGQRRHVSNDIFTLRPRSLSAKQFIAVLLAAGIAITLYSMVLNTWGNWLSLISEGQFKPQRISWIDSVTNVLSIVGSILMLARYKDQWIFWIAVNVFSIVMWLTVFVRTFDANAVPFIIMWSAFLVNAVYGYYNWNKHNPSPQRSTS